MVIRIPIDFSLTQTDDIIYIKAKGSVVDVKDFEDYAMRMHEVVMTTGLRKIIVDESEADYQLSMIESYETGVLVSERSPTNLKVAVITTDEGLEQAKFWENVTVNRGIRAAVFLTKEEAEQWLQ